MTLTTSDSTPTTALRDRAVACDIDDVAALRFEGADAAAFLQGQLSSDVGALRDGEGQWSSYNSPKGRMLASLFLWREREDVFGALLAADLAPTMARRLRMFVLRAKVAVTEMAARTWIGLAGPLAGDMAARVSGTPAVVGRSAWVSGEVLGLPDGRFVVGATDASASAGILAAATAAGATTADAAFWRYARIAAGVPLVTAAVSDQFVPQTLNFDALGGISFRKGCYPGQEIVARMHYLGRLKERLYGFASAANEVAAGARLFAEPFGDQACGTVVNTAPHPHGGVALLAVVQRAAAEGAVVHLAAPDGPALEPVALPYPVPEPAPPRGRMA